MFEVQRWGVGRARSCRGPGKGLFQSSARAMSLPHNGTRPNLLELGLEGNVRVVQKLACPAVRGGLW